ncbi:MAG: alcohol dehydrogenase catalytic domain-containing protein [Mycetocola sp.]
MTRQITTMRAIRNTPHGGPRLLELLEIPVPLRRPGEVLIEVHAAGVAYPDVLQSRGECQLRIPLPFTVGSEFAGVVAEADADSGFSPGVNFTQAAGMPINVLSADFALGSADSSRPARR